MDVIVHLNYISPYRMATSSVSSPASSSRRDFLRASILSTAVFGAERGLTAADSRQSGANAGAARNVIFMVSDGMNHGALTLAKNYRQLFEEKTTHWTRLYRERPVVRSLAETFSANSIVTDSAAAASAWGGGHRVNNGTLNILPDGKPVEPLHLFLQAKGFKTGLVTTATITHATPAGFAVNVDKRGNEAEIAQQYLDRRVDVLLGGGQKFFSDELRKKYAAAGYAQATTRDELLNVNAAAKKPLLGIFSPSHIPYSIDRNNDAKIAAEVPTLSEMTTTALNHLDGAGNGFFLMVEGARIDHAGHQNDAAASIHDQLAFDDAIATAVEYVDAHPDTLLIITTDHGCGGIQLNGVNASKNQGMAPGIYGATTQAFETIRGFKRSFEWMKQNDIDGFSGPRLADALRNYTGIRFTDDELKELQGLNQSSVDVLKKHHGIGWTSNNHTGDLVEFCALGAGSHVFSPFMENREVHNLVIKAMGLG